MPTSVYIHIPFCRRKCNYCTFVSYSDLQLIDEYVLALTSEISQRYKGENLKTLYIGGGTPSLLPAGHLKKIISLFNYKNNAEITCEANPENLSYDWLSEIFQNGINRLSLGIQSFDDNILKIIGRKHTVKAAFDAIFNARKAGFKNINVDLIYGLPTQTMPDLSTSVITACELGVEHISSYGLKIEDGSYFAKSLPENLPDEDMQADMYLKLIELTKKYGYKHYEISNFAKTGYESKHNLTYWRGENYYGFGCAASGFEGNLRYSHAKTIPEYLKEPVLLTEKEFLTDEILLEEGIFLGLRKADGIDINKINKRFSIDFEKKYAKILKKYEKYFIKTDVGYAFSDEGFLISNYILSDFIE